MHFFRQKNTHVDVAVYNGCVFVFACLCYSVQGYTYMFWFALFGGVVCLFLLYCFTHFVDFNCSFFVVAEFSHIKFPVSPSFLVFSSTFFLHLGVGMYRLRVVLFFFAFLFSFPFFFTILILFSLFFVLKRFFNTCKFACFDFFLVVSCTFAVWPVCVCVWLVCRTICAPKTSLNDFLYSCDDRTILAVLSPPLHTCAK